MIAYEELVAALSNWRVSQGLPSTSVEFVAPMPSPIENDIASAIQSQNESEIDALSTDIYTANANNTNPDKKAEELQSNDVELIASESISEEDVELIASESISEEDVSEQQYQGEIAPEQDLSGQIQHEEAPIEETLYGDMPEEHTQYEEQPIAQDNASLSNQESPIPAETYEADEQAAMEFNDETQFSAPLSDEQAAMEAAEIPYQEEEPMDAQNGIDVGDSYDDANGTAVYEQEQPSQIEDIELGSHDGSVSEGVKEDSEKPPVDFELAPNESTSVGMQDSNSSPGVEPKDHH